MLLSYVNIIFGLVKKTHVATCWVLTECGECQILSRQYVVGFDGVYPLLYARTCELLPDLGKMKDARIACWILHPVIQEACMSNSMTIRLELSCFSAVNLPFHDISWKHY